MIKIKQPKYLMAVAALALALAGCKGESPTAPTQTPPGGGGVIPPTGASVTLSVSNANPPVDSTVTITATVTIGNSPAPNGTAVEFNTTNNLGTFTDVNGPKTIRTTTNGVATVPFTSSTAGTAISKQASSDARSAARLHPALLLAAR